MLRDFLAPIQSVFSVALKHNSKANSFEVLQRNNTATQNYDLLVTTEAIKMTRPTTLKICKKKKTQLEAHCTFYANRAPHSIY